MNVGLLNSLTVAWRSSSPVSCPRNLGRESFRGARAAMAPTSADMWTPAQTEEHEERKGLSSDVKKRRSRATCQVEKDLFVLLVASQALFLRETLLSCTLPAFHGPRQSTRAEESAN